jgi:hypothetical protein
LEETNQKGLFLWGNLEMALRIPLLMPDFVRRRSLGAR